jgi:hypothetical protein
MVPRKQCLRSCIRQITEVLAIAVETIEGEETRLASVEEQLLKLRVTVPIEAHNLAIEHGRFRPTFKRKCRVQRRKGFELIAVPGTKSAIASFDIRECPESIVLQFEYPFRMIKG